MTRQKDVVRRRQGPAIFQRRVRLQRPGHLKTLAIAPPKDVGGDHQLIAAHLLITRDFVGVEIDDLHDPIRVGAAGRGDDVDDWLAADLHWRGQHVRLEREYIGTTRLFPLIINQPEPPSTAVNRPGAKWHGLGRIGRVFFKCAVTGLRRGELRSQSSIQVKRSGLDRATAGTSCRPRWKPLPLVRAGLKRRHWSNVHLRGVVLEEMIEERLQNLASKIETGVAPELYRSQRAAVANFLTMMPGAKD